ncbi:MAG: SIS domain-containing protein [Patescibacteria group bacterium]|nr:SIS domain-containing protein [Patescibacteria group bacterium]
MLALDKKSDLYNAINKFSTQFDEGFRIAEHIRFPKGVDNIVIATYGIAASTAQLVLDMFADELKDKKITISPHYDLPNNAASDTLVVGIDIEKDHPAVMTSTKKAYDKKANIVSVVTGGKLENYTRNRKLGIVKVDDHIDYMNLQIYSGLLIGIIVQILIGANFLNNKAKFKILELTQELEKMYLTKLGEKLAGQIEDSTVLIYAEPALSGMMQLIKSNLNISLNIPVFHQTLPKAFGDELIGFGKKNFAKYKALFLMDSETNEKYKKDFEIAGKLLDQSKVKHEIWELPGRNRKLSLLAGTILTYWTTYWLQEKAR